MAPAERPGILSISSRVTVPPEAPPSLSMSGSLYSTTTASASSRPAPSLASRKAILFEVTFTPVNFLGVYPTNVNSISYEPGSIGLMEYLPSKSVWPAVTVFPFRRTMTFTKGSGSPLSWSVTVPFSVPEPIWALMNPLHRIRESAKHNFRSIPLRFTLAKPNFLNKRA